MPEPVDPLVRSLAYWTLLVSGLLFVVLGVLTSEWVFVLVDGGDHEHPPGR